MKFKIGLCLAAFVILGACEKGVVPATGEQTRSLISPAEEQRIGDREHQNIIKAYGGVISDPQIAGYVASVGGRLAAVSETPNAQWTFTVLDTPIVNAFALPGGYIYVSRGLLALANDEAEMASVLAHEIAHVTARHSAQRQTRGTIAQVGSVLAAIGLQVAGVDNGGQLGQVLQTGAQGYVAGYSRTQELEADQLGIRYLARAGYDPQAAADFLVNLGEEAALKARLQGKAHDPNHVGFLHTHPATPQRIQEARQIAGTATAEIGVQTMRNKDTYLQAINNMVYGDSAQQGFVRGRTFAHPDLGFVFSVPEGFRLINQPDKIVALGPNDTQTMVDAVPSKGASPAQYLQNVWVPGMRRQSKTSNLTDYATFSANGLPAATGLIKTNTNKGTRLVRLVAIQLDNSIYRMITLYNPQGNRWLDPQLQQMATSFRRFTNADRARYRPYRLRTQPYNGESLNRIAARMPFSELALERLRVLNGLTGRESLQRGQFFKTVE